MPGDFALTVDQTLRLGFGMNKNDNTNLGIGQWDDIQVNVYTDFDQYLSSIASESDGDFVVVWQDVVQDGGYDGIFARRFSSAGQPLTLELAINGATVGPQRGPAVAMDGDGDFVVSWQGPNPSFGAMACCTVRYSADDRFEPQTP